jgi:hypothetical protein
MSRRVVGAEQPTKPRDWDKFWGTVWLNLFNALGILAVVSLVVGFGGAILWDIFKPTRPSSSSTPTDSTREQMQANFNKLLFANPKPCATKNTNVLDVTACSLFGVRLGMTLGEVEKVIDGSAYFASSSHMQDCYDKCAGTVYQQREGFSVSVSFEQASPGDKTRLSAYQITLIFGPSANPYFDPEAFRGMFVRMIGPPDTTTGEDNIWGSSDGQSVSMRAYSYSDSYWVVLERPRRSTEEKASPPAEAKK